VEKDGAARFIHGRTMITSDGRKINEKNLPDDLRRGGGGKCGERKGLAKKGTMQGKVWKSTKQGGRAGEKRTIGRDAPASKGGGSTPGAIRRPTIGSGANRREKESPRHVQGRNYRHSEEPRR